jgi:hydrogenase-4 component E
LLAILGTYGIPLIIELGVFLDVLMGFMAMQVFVYHIHGTFQSIDVEQLNRLKH